ncbi:crotonase/enoyl-CoA hydratase family protein [Paraburkholderia sp. CNPSo 3157]|uniref:Crotonase/enoyl-CoA hydratase family protein n=1 Tax=Paraburkholderia franconis TaxID=2654983 RepID=A0A7X1NI95_9BURK|nr:crotonase/enoyl-CoA hydratase family protein [Paraburkholderia franconis]MPW22327.1 crotonase/enoyl-CoA hydratase family protein [Paraburkholderia franconis]
MHTENTEAAQPLIQIEREDEIALVKLNRASKRNAINDALLAELDAAFSHGLNGARAVILHGEGEHFCAGLDLFELLSKRSPDVLVGMRRSRQWHRTFDLIQYGELPVISVLKGGVIGGGFELAAATHVRVAELSAFFQLPEGQRGIFLGGGGSVRIPRLIGASRVIEMMLTGNVLDVDTAHRIGLAHHVTDNGAGLARARELAGAIVRNAPATNYAIINGIGRISEMPLGEGLFAETMVTAMTRSANTDAAKRISEFFDGRRQASATAD